MHIVDSKHTLDSRHKAERMRLPGAESAFLFLDRNHNDRNGRIDSADPAFGDLRLWQAGDGDRQQVRCLDEAGVGALATASALTPFQLKEDGITVARM